MHSFITGNVGSPNGVLGYVFLCCDEALATTRKALHVGANQYGGRDIYGNFVKSGDFMRSIRPLMPVNFRLFVCCAVLCCVVLCCAVCPRNIPRA